MSDTQLTTEQVASRRTSGRWMVVAGFIMLFFGVYISAFLIPDVLQSAGGPQSLPLEKAARAAGEERIYARVEDGNWDCDTLKHVEGLSASSQRYGGLREEVKTTEIFFTNGSDEVVVFVTLSGEVECDELTGESPSGYLYAMSSSTRQELTNDARLARYFAADSFLELCGYCGRDNSLIGAVFGVVFLVLGVVAIILGRRQLRTYADEENNSPKLNHDDF